MAHLRKAEKSRMHAKQRRTEEAKEIADIAGLLPLPSNVTKRLDKASVLRLAITFLRLKKYVGEDKTLMEQLQESSVGEGGLLLETLSGFFIIISAQEEILFVSENVEKHMGLKQIDLLGKNVFEFVYEKDREELQKQFQDKYQGRNISGMGLNAQGDPIEMNIKYSTVAESTPVLEQHRQFFLRMKCSYQRRGVSNRPPFSVSSTQSDFVLLQWTGYLHYDAKGQVSFLAAVARPLQPTPIMELKMDGNMFISRHSLDMRFMYCDPRLSTLLGYEPSEFEGSSMYQFHHPGDLDMCRSCHNNLMTAGTSISKYYRFLSKNNEWCWLQTRATIVYNTAKHPQYIVCMNYIVSEREGRRYLMEHLKETSKSSEGEQSSYRSTSSNSRVCQTGVGNIISNMSGIQLNDDMMMNKLLYNHQEVNDVTQQALGHPIVLSPGTVGATNHVTAGNTSVPSGGNSPLSSVYSPESYHSGHEAHSNQPGSHTSTHPNSIHSGYSSPQSYHLNHPSPHSANPSPSIYHSPDNSHHHSPYNNHQQSPAYSCGQQSPEVYQQQSTSSSAVQSPTSNHLSPPVVEERATSPTFYLPQEDNEKPEEVNTTDDLALGNLWLSVHSMMDPGSQHVSEIVPPSLACEMEDITFEHCHHLMTQSTMAAVNLYSNIPTPTVEPMVDHGWGHCEKLIDMQAINMFKRFKTNREAEVSVKKSKSSSSLTPTLSSGCCVSSIHPSEVERSASGGSSSSNSKHSSGSQDSGVMVKVKQSASAGFLCTDETPLEGDHFRKHLLEQQQRMQERQLAEEIAEYAENMDIMTEEETPTNMPPNSFGELPDIDELFMQYPELNSQTLSEGFMSSDQPSMPLSLSDSMMSLGSAPSYTVNHRYQSMSSLFNGSTNSQPSNCLASNESAMSLTSNPSHPMIHSVNSLVADMDVHEHMLPPPPPSTSRQSASHHSTTTSSTIMSQQDVTDLYDRLLEEEKYQSNELINYWINHS